MKKNILLILLSCFALSGCKAYFDLLKAANTNNDTSEAKEPIDENSGEKPQNSQENSENNINDQNPEGPIEEVPETPHGGTIIAEDGSYVTTIYFCGEEFSEITSGQAGYVFSDHPEVLQNYCASKLDGTNMLSSIQFENLNTAMYDKTLYLSVGTGYYANDKFKEGLFKWTSKLLLHKVEIQAKAYSKLTSGGLTDPQSVIWIDDESVSLACDTDAAPTSKSLSKEYPNGTSTFSIKSTGSRVMLESLKITWRYLYEA